MRRLIRSLVILASALLLLLTSVDAKKRNKEDATQTLEELPEPPAAVAGQTRRLEFHVSPLITHGNLSQQTREAIRDILRQNGGMRVVKIRAFVSGTGDLRRVSQIAAETFTEKKRVTIPALSVVQTGGLPADGAAVVLESVSEAKRDVNPNGLLFVSAVEQRSAEPLQPLEPLARKSLDDLAVKLAGHGEALRVTCYATSLENATQLSAAMSQKFPNAVLDLVQSLRAPSNSAVACESVARSSTAANPDVSGVAFVDSPSVVFTGTQEAFGFRDADARIALQHIDKILAPFGASTRSASLLDFFPLSTSIATQIARLRSEFLDAKNAPAITTVRVEGLPGMDASFAVEAIAPATTVP